MSVGVLSSPSPEPGDSVPRKPKAVKYFSSLEKTAAQLQLLRSVVDITLPFLAPRPSNPFDGSDMPATEENARSAASETAVMAFHQIRNIIDDQGRWNITESALERESRALFAAEAEFAAARAALARTCAQPFYMLNAKLGRTSEGYYTAVSADGAVTANGSTADEAIQNFNDTVSFGSVESPSEPKE
jgi:hypothetical protein